MNIINRGKKWQKMNEENRVYYHHCHGCGRGALPPLCLVDGVFCSVMENIDGAITAHGALCNNLTSHVENTAFYNGPNVVMNTFN